MPLHRPTQGHTKDIQVLEQSIKDTRIRATMVAFIANLRMLLLAFKSMLSELIANDVSVPRFENGWTLPAWSRLVEVGKNVMVCH